CFQKAFFRKPAFVELLDKRYGKRMLRWFAGFGVEANLAFDLKQEVSMRCWKPGLGQFRPQDVRGQAQLFCPWLYVVCYNLFIGRALRPRHRVLADAPAAFPASAEEDPVGEALKNEVNTAIDRLSPPERKVLGLLIEGYSPREMAQRLDLSVEEVY